MAARPRGHGHGPTRTRVRADAICTARTQFVPRPRVIADAGGRPDGHFHPKTSVMTSLLIYSLGIYGLDATHLRGRTRVRSNVAVLLHVTSKSTLQCVQVTDAPVAIVRSSVRLSENVCVTTLPALGPLLHGIGFFWRARHWGTARLTAALP
jgi:hypothetical protein